MADVTSRVETVSNAGATVATFGANFGNYKISQADVGREFVVSVTADAATLTQAKLDEAVKYLTRNNYTSSNTDASSAGTIAAIGTADGTAYDPAADTVVYVRYQTTQDFAVTDFNAGDSTGVTLAIVAEFKPAL